MKYGFIIFFFRAVFSKSIIASLHGIEKNQCDLLNPCDFSSAKRKIEDKDILYIIDNYTDSPSELKKLQSIFQYALDKKCFVVSHNMTVNGSLLAPLHFPYIVNNRAEECQITGFFFTEFHSSIFCLRGVKKVFISECSFYNNTLTKEVGLIILSFSTCKIKNCNFSQNSINQTSIISILSSFCILECCNISSNTVFHNSHQGIILSSNSNCDFVNVTFDSNRIKHSSPIIQFEWRSYIAFYNSSFVNNNYDLQQMQRNLIECDGICEISMYESIIVHNNCSILSVATEDAIINMNSMNISFNQAGNYPLFEIPGGFFTFSLVSIIEGNSFSSFVDFHNLKSEVSLSYVQFIKNNSTDFYLNIDDESNLSLEYSSFFDNYCQKGIINGNNVYMNLKRNGFINNDCQSINCQNCSTKIFSNAFISSTDISINISANPSSKTFVFGSYFSNNLDDHISEIVFNGKTLLLMLRFNYSCIKLSSPCYLCYYNQRKSGVFTGWSVLLTFILSLLLIFVIVTYFNKFLQKMNMDQIKKNQ